MVIGVLIFLLTGTFDQIVQTILTLTVPLLLFRAFKCYHMQDEYNSDLWASWHFKSSYGRDASNTLEMALKNLERIKNAHLEEHRLLRLRKAVFRNTVGSLDIHPSLEERVAYVRKYLEE